MLLQIPIAAAMGRMAIFQRSKRFWRYLSFRSSWPNGARCLVSYHEVPDDTGTGPVEGVVRERGDGFKPPVRIESPYLSSQTFSMRQLLMMLLTIIVQSFTCGCQQ
jgi:hypothetical protein